MKDPRRILYLTLCILCLSGCRTPTPPRTPLEILRDRASAIAEAGGVAAIGEGKSPSASIALDKAKNRAIVELAVTLGRKVQALQNQFAKETAANQNDPCLALFNAAAQILTGQELLGGIPVDVIHETREGITTAWILVAVEPKIVFDAFACQATAQPELYARFSKSNTFTQLKESLKTYAEFKTSVKIGNRK